MTTKNLLMSRQREYRKLVQRVETQEDAIEFLHKQTADLMERLKRIEAATDGHAI